MDLIDRLAFDLAKTMRGGHYRKMSDEDFRNAISPMVWTMFKKNAENLIALGWVKKEDLQNGF